MKAPMLVEIIAYAPTAFYHCTHCEVAFREMGRSDEVQKEQLASSLPADLMKEYVDMSDWVRDVFRIHGNQVLIKVIDAASVEGVFKSLRYGTRRFPAVVVDRRGRFAGKDALARAAEDIRLRLKETGIAAMPA